MPDLPEGLDTGGQDDDSGDGGVEQIADPDNYAHRRRLKELYDAKERVRETKARALRMDILEDYSITETQRNRVIVEDLVDYIHELMSLLKDREEMLEKFRDESIDLDKHTAVTIDEIARTRGRKQNGARTPGVQLNRDGDPIDYRAAMEAWHVCNDYFEDLAGPDFKRSSMPKESGFQSAPTPSQEADD